MLNVAVHIINIGNIADVFVTTIIVNIFLYYSI